MELTLPTGFQAIVIFDPEIPYNELIKVYPLFGIQPNDASDSQHAPIHRLSSLLNLGDIYSQLEKLPYFAKKFIVLPNINESGQFTLFRHGLSDHYKSMPCVGGYLDHEYARLGQGKLTILNGQDGNYGNKAIGVFPTSDNRHADFRLLGQNVAWVKWSHPSAEALRQACLARSTRIAHTEPPQPDIVISRILVSDSTFLGSLDIAINCQFNALIGGRGTGKSSLLEYIRWALFDQTPRVGDAAEIPDLAERRKALIKNTLVPKNATVALVVTKNKVPHTIARNALDNSATLAIGDAPPRPTSSTEINQLFPIQAYSQKQLSSVAIRTEELIRFVNAPIQEQLAVIDGQISSKVEQMRKKFLEWNHFLRVESESKSLAGTIQSTDQQAKALRAQVSSLSEADAAVLASHEQIVSEDLAIKKWLLDLAQISASIEAVAVRLESEPSPNSALQAESATLQIREIHSSLDNKYKSVRQSLLTILAELTSAEAFHGQLGSLKNAWDVHVETTKSTYSALQSRMEAEASAMEKFSEVSAELKRLEDKHASLVETLNRMGSPEEDYELLLADWRDLYSGKADLIEQQCANLNRLSGGILRATLRRGAGTADIATNLSAAFSGARVYKEKIDAMANSIANSPDPLGAWSAALADLKRIALEGSSSAVLDIAENLPALKSYGFTQNEIERISERLDLPAWESLVRTSMLDLPQFEYQLQGTTYIPFDKVSAGQQASALLRVLLNEPGPPLIIDQPEDDLDNRTIQSIVEDFWKAKRFRQLIITSHNANIVVNGDADLVLVCGESEMRDSSRGKIVAQGAIDIDSINKHIRNVMEGGEQAFQLRTQKYGF